MPSIKTRDSWRRSTAADDFSWKKHVYWSAHKRSTAIMLKECEKPISAGATTKGKSHPLWIAWSATRSASQAGKKKESCHVIPSTKKKKATSSTVNSIDALRKQRGWCSGWLQIKPAEMGLTRTQLWSTHNNCVHGIFVINLCKNIVLFVGAIVLLILDQKKRK